MPYYGDSLPYYYGGPFSNHSSLMTGTGRSLHSPLGSSRYAPHLTTISESPLSALRRYTPAATISTRPKRVIDTADIDVSTPRALSNTNHNNGNQRNRLRRDRPTIRIRSQALKDNPALREHYERHEKTVGELLVEKFLIKDKKNENDGELRTKLYTQISLDNDEPETSNKQQDDLQEALQRRVTRRMTRRRSSADVQMNPEQIEREVMFAQAQADALDSLVAQEQAEIEVETRMGTLIRKNLVRSVGPLIRSKHDGQGLSGGVDDEDESRTKKLAKKVKKRKKTTDKPSPPSESELDSEQDVTRMKKIPKDTSKETDNKSLKIDARESLNGETRETNGDKDNSVSSEEPKLSPTKAMKFKIEASNSVGDFSTLWINSGVAEEHEKQRKISQGIVEQFRDSVRLPAPKQSIDKYDVKSNKKDVIIEEHQQIVVLPVKKRYVKDDTRNSVYLTLKTQKNTNVNKMAGTDDTIDRIEAIDDKVDKASSSNGKAIDEEKLTNMSSIANATSLITRQPRINKVAKFRSKDITESDVEVKSISELTGRSGVTKGKIGTKDVGLQKLSGLNDDTSYVIANESISVSLKRDANVDATNALIEDHTKEQISSKVVTAFNEETKNLEFAKTRDTNSTPEVVNSKLIVSTIVPTGVKDDKIPADKDEITEKSRKSSEVNEKIDKPLKRAKKEIKELQKNNSNTIVDESKRLKRSVTSSLDSSSTRLNVENSNERKNEEKEQLLGNGTDSCTAVISSVVRSFSNDVESLPNASTINFTDVETCRLNDAVKISNEEFNVKAIEKEEKTRIADENFIANEDLSLTPKITGKFVEIRGDISKPIGVTSEVVGFGNLRKVKEEHQNVVEQPATRIETPNILITTRKDVNFQKSENDEKLTDNSTNKTISSVDAASKDDKNVVELPKLRKNCKILPLSSRNNSAESVESSPNTPDIEVVTDDTKKIQTRTKKRLVNATTNGDEISSSKLEKSLKDSAIVAKSIEDSTEKKIKTLKSTNEPEKLTNGVVNTKSKTIIAVKELPKPEVNKKITKKLEAAPSVKKDEEIDFWGEIESQRIAEPSLKIIEKIVQTKPKISDDSIAKKAQSDDIGDSMVIVLEPEAAKSNTSPESGTPDETKILIGGEKKLNKAKKKKTSDSSGCKKKDQEKESSKTIFEHFTSPDVVDEKSHQQQQQQPEQLEQQCEKLGEKNLVEDSSSKEKISEILEIDRFERNLSTIDEESLSPVFVEIPKNVEALEQVTSNLRKEEDRAITKLDTTRNLSSLDGDSESSEGTTKKNLSSSVPTKLGETEVPKVEKDEIRTKLSIKLKEQPIDDDSLQNSDVSVPAINIIEAPSSPLKVEILPEVIPEEEVIEDEGEEGPGTPTNETVDETIINQLPNNITKWHGRADLSLDEPDKDIGPEVYALEEAKKESAKKKVSSSKKKTSKKNSVGSNSTKSTGTSPDSSKKKKLAKRKKSSTKNAVKDSDKTRIDERSESKVSNSSDTTLKPGIGGQYIRNSPINSGHNSPKQRPLDLIKMFYTTPASLLTATPRDLSKVRRAKVKKRKHSTRTASASSDSTGSTRSTQSTGTAESTGSTEHEDDAEQKRISSTRSNDSGFDGSPRLSNCDMACHKKCEKLTGNLCGLNQKLVAEALQALKRAPSQSSDNQRNSDGSDHHASGRITPPATNLPRFKKYTVMDFHFLKVLGKGSFGKVLLAELRRTDCVYAVKCLKKDVVLEDDDVECTLIERKVLTLATRHPYLCHLFCTFQTDSHLFFVMEYLNGGDLMFHIQKSGRFAETRARFYAAEIWSGLIFLHKKGIVYRDLKLDNVLLDFEGHIRIADFGMCKLQIFLDRTADTFCGTPDYMAPEIIKGLKYNQAVDWWSFGVLLYEMLTGQSPFSGCDEDELFWSICNERPFIPRYLSQEAMDVLICLLEKDAGKRPPGHEIAVHPFFHSLQWERLERRQLEPPFKPALEHTLDTRYFDTAFTAERPRLTPVPEQILTSMDQGVFRGFSYTNPNATD